MSSDKQVHILLVEDNAADAMLFKKIFQGLKFPNTISVADDGEHALEFLRDGKNEKPNFILMDINMPRKDGKSALKEIKTDPTLKHIPILMLTSSRAGNDVKECYELHANGYVPKPANIEEHKKLLTAIEEFWFDLAILPT